MNKKKMNTDELVLFFVPRLFAFFGIIFIIAGVGTFLKARNEKARSVETEAVITTIGVHRSGDDTTHDVYISYVYEGREYDNVRLSFYSSDMYEGKTIIVYIDPENPRHAMSKGEDIFMLIVFGFMGTVFSFIGFTIIAISKKGQGQEKKLRENGRVIHAVVSGFGYNGSVTVNGNHPHVVYCSYEDPSTGTIYQFKSKDLFSDPSMVMAVGDYVDVLVDPNDYSKHYVDVDKAMSRIVSYI